MAARSLIGAFLADERGATAIEYGLIVSLVFLAIITGITSFGNNTSSIIGKVANAVGAAG